MAITNSNDAFNPGVPTIEPGSYLHLFKPSDLSLQSALGAAFKGLGDVVDSVTKGVDAIIKSGVEKARKTEVEPVVEGHQKDLEATYGDQAVNQLLKPNSVNQQGSIVSGANQPMQTVMPGPAGTTSAPPPEQSTVRGESLTGGQDKLPTDIKDFTGRANAIYNARQDGHVSDTYYWGRLADIASDIRSRYPRGYRDYIDNKIQQITGRDPANAYVEAMIRDINSNIGDKNKARDQLITQFYQNNFIARPGANEMVKGLINGTKTVNEGVDFLASMQKDDDTMDRSKKEYELAKQRGENAEEAAARHTNAVGPAIVNNFFRGLSAVGGPGLKGLHTPEELNQIIADWRQNPSKVNSQTAQTLAIEAQAWVQAAEKGLRDKYQLDGVTRDMANNPDKLNKIIDTQLLPLKQVQQAFSTGDLSAAAHVALANKAAQDDFTQKMYNQKDMNGYLLSLDFWRKTLGDQAIVNVISRPAYQGAMNAFDQKSKSLFAQLMTPDEIYKEIGGKDVHNLSEAIDNINKGATNSGYDLKNPQVVKTYNQLFDMIEHGLADKGVSDTTRKQAITSIFSPDNIGVLRKLAPDKIDPNDPSKTIPGYQSLFYRLTQPDIVANVKAMGPEYQKMYENWLNSSVNDIFRKDLSQISEALPGMTKESGVQIDWNTKTHNFDVKVNNESVTGNFSMIDRRMRQMGVRSGMLAGVKIPVDSMNKGLSGMANVARGLGLKGDDIDGYVLNQLVSAGVKGLTNVQGMPPQIKEAITRAYAEQHAAQLKAEMNRARVQEMYTTPTPKTPAEEPAEPNTTKRVRTIRFTPGKTQEQAPQ